MLPPLTLVTAAVIHNTAVNNDIYLQYIYIKMLPVVLTRLHIRSDTHPTAFEEVSASAFVRTKNYKH